MCATLDDQKTDEHRLTFDLLFLGFFGRGKCFVEPFLILTFCFGVVLKNPTFLPSYHSLKKLWLIFFELAFRAYVTALADTCRNSSLFVSDLET